MCMVLKELGEILSLVASLIIKGQDTFANPNILLITFIYVNYPHTAGT